MKKRTLLLGLLLVGYSLVAQVPNYVPTNGLVGWWPFNGNANDESGNGNNGTVNGATLTSDRNGNANSSYYFSGSSCNTSIDANVNTSSINSAFTISYWMMRVGNGCLNSRIWEFCPGPVGSVPGAFEAYWYNSTNIAGIDQITSTSSVISTTTNALLDNNWMNVIYSNNGLQAKLWVNGSLVDSSTSTGIISLATNFSIGRMGHSAYDAFNGNIDDIVLWNRALTQQEVTNLYNSCANTTASISSGGNTTFCQGGSVTLTANGGGGYNWSNGSNNQNITVSNGGIYTVTVTNGNCTATASQIVTVNPAPNVSITPLPQFVNINAANVTLSGTPAGGSFTGSGVSSNQLSPADAGLGFTQVTYTYTNANNCSNSATTSTIVYDTTGVVCTSTTYDTVTTYLSVTDTLKINLNLTGINPPNNNNLVSAYPNPAKDHLFIDCGNFASMAGYTIKITNTLGQVVFNQSVTQQQFYIDLSTWGGNGTYILYILDQNQAVKSQKKIVLQ
jgi:hypothetical protein